MIIIILLHAHANAKCERCPASHFSMGANYITSFFLCCCFVLFCSVCILAPIIVITSLMDAWITGLFVAIIGRSIPCRLCHRQSMTLLHRRLRDLLHHLCWCLLILFTGTCARERRRVTHFRFPVLGELGCMVGLLVAIIG